MASRRWEYLVKSIHIVDRWKAKKQEEEIARLHDELNELGAEGWELIGLQEIRLVGGLSGKEKGGQHLALWKREVS